MRSTRGVTRAMRVTSKPHYTDAARVTAPAHSTERDRYGSRELPAGVATGTGRRAAGFTRMNTNTNLRNGGISSYYRSRERGYSA